MIRRICDGVLNLMNGEEVIDGKQRVIRDYVLAAADNGVLEREEEQRILSYRNLREAM
tara:strand:+ start:143 stop:316 length:174 start_codon:yes stop_codon:yes gene_type:complete